MTTELDQFFGSKPSRPISRRKTLFSRVPPGAREYCDEWLNNIRALYEDPDYYPDRLEYRTWAAQAKELFNGHGRYKPGFLTWALQEHIRRFKRQGKAPVFTGPLSVNYLWHEYDGHLVGPRVCERCGKSLLECECE
jgi:hypothetical protein